jgi:outer membrane protein TolC
VPEIASEALEAHILYGLRYRPEVARIAYAQAELSLDLELGRNQLLPRFDLEAFVAQDFGGSATSKREYDPTVYNVGLGFELPVLQRKARGKLQQTRAKLSKLGFELRMLTDSIEAEVRDAASAYRRALERIAFARRNYALALELEEAERILLRAGGSDLIRVNIREQSTAKSRSSLVEAEALAFIALADYRASLGLPKVPEGGLRTDIEPGVAPVRRMEADGPTP